MQSSRTTSNISSISSGKDVSFKSCEIENCQRISAVLCHHCKANICRRHFIEHADHLTQELHPLADQMNELNEKINSFSVEEYEQKLIDQLTKWRNETIKNINELYEFKKQKLDLLFQENQKLYQQQTKNYLEIVSTLKNEAAAFIKENDIVYEELQVLKEKLRTLEINVKAMHTHLVSCDIKPLLIDYSAILIQSTENNYMCGGTLLGIDYQMKLNDFYGNPTQKWQLIYKATRNGFDAKDFHRCSDNKGPTMTIIKSQNANYLFGGYTSLSWTSDGEYKNDSEAFLFTLTNPHGIQPIKFPMKSHRMFAVCHANNRGPCFGGIIKDTAHLVDIRISNNANKNRDSECSFPSSYLDTTGKDEKLFTGEKNFMVDEIEIYNCVVENK
ncbi:hypothetical protein I4U23_021908 [Adineta vaga]|nr:hypothetical protein I4U23_021908 [Adineta vaga]